MWKKLTCPCAPRAIIEFENHMIKVIDVNERYNHLTRSPIKALDLPEGTRLYVFGYNGEVIGSFTMEQISDINDLINTQRAYGMYISTIEPYGCMCRGGNMISLMLIIIVIFLLFILFEKMKA